MPACCVVPCSQAPWRASSGATRASGASRQPTGRCVRPTPTATRTPPRVATRPFASPRCEREGALFQTSVDDLLTCCEYVSDKADVSICCLCCFRDYCSRRASRPQTYFSCDTDAWQCVERTGPTPPDGYNSSDACDAACVDLDLTGVWRALRIDDGEKRRKRAHIMITAQQIQHATIQTQRSSVRYDCAKHTRPLEERKRTRRCLLFVS